MDSDTTITILGLLLLAAGFGLALMARALEEARSHQRYLRGQVSKYRRMARGREADDEDLGAVSPPGTPIGWRGSSVGPPDDMAALRPSTGSPREVRQAGPRPGGRAP